MTRTPLPLSPTPLLISRLELTLFLTWTTNTCEFLNMLLPPVRSSAHEYMHAPAIYAPEDRYHFENTVCVKIDPT